MALIRIPDRLISSFKVLFGLPIPTIEHLVEQLVNRPVGTTIGTLADNVASEGLARRDEIHIALTILDSIFDAYGSNELSVDDFISEFTKALIESEVISDANRQFEILIKQLLTNDQNQILTDKFMDLVREGERIISSGRIVTDVRPMVDEDDDNSILGATIVHQLRLSFIENNEKKSLYFLLNGNDLDELEKMIRRAKNKESSFKKTFSSNNIIFFDEK